MRHYFLDLICICLWLMLLQNLIPLGRFILLHLHHTNWYVSSTCDWTLGLYLYYDGLILNAFFLHSLLVQPCMWHSYLLAFFLEAIERVMCYTSHEPWNFDLFLYTVIVNLFRVASIFNLFIIASFFGSHRESHVLYQSRTMKFWPFFIHSHC